MMFTLLEAYNYFSFSFKNSSNSSIEIFLEIIFPMLSIRKLVGKAKIDKRFASVSFLSQDCFQTSLLSAITLSQSYLLAILSTEMPTIWNPLLLYCLYRFNIFGNCRRQGAHTLYQKSIRVYLLRKKSTDDNFSLFLLFIETKI